MRWLGFRPSLAGLLAILAMLTIAPLVALSVWLLDRTVTERREDHVHQLRSLAATLAHAIDRDLRGWRETAEVLAATPQLQSRDLPAFHALASAIVEKSGGHFALIDRDGKQVLNTRVPYGVALPEFRSLPSALSVIATGNPAFSGIVVGNLARSLVFGVHVPVLKNGEVIYTLAHLLDARLLQAALEQHGLPEGWLAAILDTKGVIAARSKRPEAFVGRPMKSDIIERLTAPQGLLETVDLEDRAAVTAYHVSPAAEWRALVWAPREYLDAPSWRARLGGLAILGAAVLLSAATATLASRIIRNPIRRTVVAAGALARGEPIDERSTYMAETDLVSVALADAGRAIAERQQALAESEQRIRHIANATPAMLWIATPDGRIWASDRWFEFTGIPKGDIARRWRDAVHPDDREHCRIAWKEALATGRDYVAECRILGRDGHYRWFKSHAVAEVQDGRITGWNGSTSDIDELKRAERSRAVSEERLRLAQDVAGLGSAEWDLTTDRATWSALFAQLFDLPGSGAESDGRSLLAHILAATFPEDLDRLEKQHKAILEHGGSLTEEIRLRRRDGSIAWRHLRAEVFCDSSGRPERLIAVGRDITRRKQVELELARFATVAEASSEAILGCDLEGHIEVWNSAAERLYGWSGAEVKGRSIAILCEPGRASEFLEMIARAARGEPSGATDATHRRRDGQPIDVSVSIAPVRNAEGRVIDISVSAHDVSERKRHEAHTRFVMRELSHRSKNLLAIVQAMARQTARTSRGIEEFQSRFAERVASLARSHDLLVKGDWAGAYIGDLVSSQLMPFIGREQTRIATDGPQLLLKPEAAQNIGMALHELATNAAKHGALSLPGGKISIAWRVDSTPEGGTEFHLTWTEQGGPPVAAPEGRGFGSNVVERLVPSALDGTATLDWTPQGVVWHLAAPLLQITGESAQNALASADFDIGTSTPELRGLYRSWAQLKGTDRLPRFASFDPLAIDGREQLIVASLAPGKHHLRVLWVGADLERVLPPGTETATSGVAAALMGAIERCHALADATASPCYDWVRAPADDGQVAAYELLSTPFSDSGSTVTHIVAMVIFRGWVTSEGPRTELAPQQD